MTRRTKKKFTPARCELCRAPIIWRIHRSSWVKLHPGPVRDTRTYVGPRAFVIEGRVAWRLDHLVTELMGRRECTENEARQEAHDMTWHPIHICSDTANSGGDGVGGMSHDPGTHQRPGGRP